MLNYKGVDRGHLQQKGTGKSSRRKKRHHSDGSQRDKQVVVAACAEGFGQALGKRPLAPTISPNKTVEGFLGGMAAALIAGGVASRWAPLAFWPLKSLLIAFGGLAGDLAASHFKRRHRIKDFSNGIPYHGGFLDRVDSLITVGAACFYLSLFA